MESAVGPREGRQGTIAAADATKPGSSQKTTMQAIVYHSYGSPDVLELKEVEMPVVGDDDVLIRVRAASVNPYDWHFMRGEPMIARPQLGGLRKPKSNRLGVDVAGEVVAVGNKVREFRPGDEVFGACTGAFAEYAIARESSLVLKPANVTFEQAGAVGIAAFTAIQSLRDWGQIEPGQKVLINGAAGGVGTFAVQLAKVWGAEVTAVCSTRNVDMVRSIGADHVVDYTKDDFTRGVRSLRPDARHHREPVAFKVQAGADPPRNLRDDRRPQGKMDTTAGSHTASVRAVSVRKPEDGLADRDLAQRRPGSHAGAHGRGQSRFCNRQNVFVERGTGGSAVSGRRACPGQGGNHGLERAEAPRRSVAR